MTEENTDESCMKMIRWLTDRWKDLHIEFHQDGGWQVSTCYADGSWGEDRWVRGNGTLHSALNKAIETTVEIARREVLESTVVVRIPNDMKAARHLMMCPVCASTSVNGLMASFWVPLERDGETVACQWSECESSTELTNKRMCGQCGHEFGS